jgi:hypothetical protein
MNQETAEAELMHTIVPRPTLSGMMKEAVLVAYGRVLNIQQAGDRVKSRPATRPAG